MFRNGPKALEGYDARMRTRGVQIALVAFLSAATVLTACGKSSKSSDTTPVVAETSAPAPDTTVAAAPSEATLAATDTTSLAPNGGEIWRLFVWLLVIAYVIEAITGYMLSARREKLRAAEANA